MSEAREREPGAGVQKADDRGPIRFSHSLHLPLFPSLLLSTCLLVLLVHAARAEPPSASYIFPAGGQRGTKVLAKVGGHYLHDKAAFEILGPGVSGPSEIRRTATIWFEGPMIKQPASQAAEDYPQDYAAEISLAPDAPLGVRSWRAWNAQGITPAMKFVVGDLPEIVEDEIDGEPIPAEVTVPVTINGRIFPREDIDVWSFDAAAGHSVTCSVAAAEFGSPLKPRLQARGPDGRLLAETTGDALGRVQLRFTPSVSGRHEVHIHDVQAGGLQHYVYRLTITGGPWIDSAYPLGGRRGAELTLHALGQSIPGNEAKVKLSETVGIQSLTPMLEGGARTGPTSLLLDVDDLPEQLEAEPNQDAASAAALAVPAIANGRIDQPGDRDLWKVTLTKGQSVQLSLRAGQLGSPLAGVVKVRDREGKELASAAWLDQQKDVELPFVAPADGDYTLEVGEQFPSRGGPAFAYRLRAAPPAADFEPVLPSDGLAVEVGGTQKLEVKILRRDFAAPVTLHVEGLPAGVTCEDATVPASGDKAALVFKAGDSVPVTTAALRIVARGGLPGQFLEKVARAPSRPGEPPLDGLRLVTTLKTPFKFAAQYDFRYTPRGTVLKKRYAIDRGGYEGPLVAQLADRQGRHLQGVTGPTVNIPAGATEFEYSLFLPPWMELGRTSRTNLMLTGEVKDSAGSLHKVCFTTRDQNEQMIALVSPSLLRIASEKSSLLVQPGGQSVVPIHIQRDRTISSPIRLELVLPRHMGDIAAEPVTVAPAAETAEFRLRFGSLPGPLNMPLVIRATAEKEGVPVVAELSLEPVAAP